MRILVFEHLTGGGLLGGPSPSGSLLTEGRAMVQAVSADLLALPEAEVWTTRDARLPPLHPAGCQVTAVTRVQEVDDVLARLAAAADWSLLIAPETDNVLFDQSRRVEKAGRRLLSPCSAIVEIATNKETTAERLSAWGVPVPAGQIVRPGEAPPIGFGRCVLKPIDGCGSQDVRYFEIREAVRAACAALDRPMRLETYVPGLAASVAVLCGPNEQRALPACQQRLTKDGRFTYLGGRTPLAADLDARARKLAQAAVGTLPNPVGYIGVDLVLGEAADGSEDYVIEINPRLTTSYVGLRASCHENLAAAMLTIAAGRPATLSFRSQPLEFAADGTILRCSPSSLD
jgi:predicted ATP-grasp superfamily ATP-dependent carboligase